MMSFEEKSRETEEWHHAVDAEMQRRSIEEEEYEVLKRRRISRQERPRITRRHLL